MDKRNIESGLVRKGFTKEEGDHHYFIYYTIAGKRTPIKTKTSHGGEKALSDFLLSQMSRQCNLTKAEFIKLIECPLSRDDYEAILKQKDKI